MTFTEYIFVDSPEKNYQNVTFHLPEKEQNTVFQPSSFCGICFETEAKNDTDESNSTTKAGETILLPDFTMPNMFAFTIAQTLPANGFEQRTSATIQEYLDRNL